MPYRSDLTLKLMSRPTFLPDSSMRSDWLDGYDETLCALAGTLGPGKGKKVRGTVAVVGNMYDRNEGDHTGNMDELRRLTRALGLDLV